MKAHLNSEFRTPRQIRKPDSKIARAPDQAGGVQCLGQCSRRALPAQSKTWRLRLAAFCLLLSPLCFSALAQYSIDWSTIDGGGGTSTGGVYSVSGTIGQPDAGAMSGGNFTLQGGFWGVIAAVQTPGAPLLWVTRTTTNTVVVGWALSEVNWQLQTTTNLSASAQLDGHPAAIHNQRSELLFHPAAACGQQVLPAAQTVKSVSVPQT